MSFLIIFCTLTIFHTIFCLPLESFYNYLDIHPETTYSDKNNYEIVYLPVLRPIKEAFGSTEPNNDEFQYNFSAFQRPINLKLKKNSHILSPNFKSFVVNDNENLQVSLLNRNCHYIHSDNFSFAAISLCDGKSLQGIIFLDKETYEIHPLKNQMNTEPLLEEGNYEEKIPHIIKRATFPLSNNLKDTFPINKKSLKTHENYKKQLPYQRSVNYNLTVELAMFFDEEAYKIFAPYLDYDENKIQDMLLAYLNGVQALYHQSSLGTSLKLVLVRLDIIKKQPSEMPHYDGERGPLLDSFCDYQSKINPTNDENPEHWDMAVYISGLDFFAYENGRKSGVTMGLATVGGVCLSRYACLIAELGTTNIFGKPYPSAGFTSVYILAHEIGHNLGMHHDGIGNSCSKEGFIMSPSRGTNGETQWSTCSAEVMTKLSWATCLQDSGEIQKSLDHSRFADTPGQIYTAKKQCEILLRDRDATVSTNQELSTICFNLHCRTPHRSGYYFAGPALEGTQCGPDQMCLGGECSIRIPSKPPKVIPGGWSLWQEEKCKSACLEKSKGFQIKRRYCNNPTPINTDEGCEGSSVEFGTCNDKKICKSKRLSIIDFATEKCTEFSKLLPELDKESAGLQAPHEIERIWMGCAIFCKRANSNSFYTPRIELNDLGISPYFPDGTWCHRQDNINYYCLHHHCLPENFQFSNTKTMVEDIEKDIHYLQNARPFNTDIPSNIKDYLSIDSNGKPLQTKLNQNDFNQNKEEEWETDDYIIIPNLNKQKN